jgi:hypothetical protein
MSKKEYNQQYNEKNKDRHREKVRLYYQQNREKVLLRKALVRHLAGLPVKVGNLEKLRRENLIK